MVIITEGKIDPDPKYIVSPLTDLRNIDISDKTPLLLISDQNFDPSYSFRAGCEFIQDEIIPYGKPFRQPEFPIYGIFRGFSKAEIFSNGLSGLIKVAVGRGEDKMAQYHIMLSDVFQFKEKYTNNFPNIFRISSNGQPHSEIAFGKGDFYIGKENIQKALRKIPGKEIYADLLDIVEAPNPNTQRLC